MDFICTFLPSSGNGRRELGGPSPLVCPLSSVLCRPVSGADSRSGWLVLGRLLSASAPELLGVTWGLGLDQGLVVQPAAASAVAATPAPLARASVVEAAQAGPVLVAKEKARLGCPSGQMVFAHSSVGTEPRLVEVGVSAAAAQA